MAEKKRTQVEVLGEIKALEVLTEEQREVLEKVITSIQKKNSYKSKTKNKEHEALEEKIVEVLSAEPNRIFTCAEVAKTIGGGLTTQKLTPRLASLVECGKIAKTVEKKVNHYQWAE